jgi:hypothetical protein
MLLGTANLVFWQIFITDDILAAGYSTTSLHWLFAVLQLLAATAPAREAGRWRIGRNRRSHDNTHPA